MPPFRRFFKSEEVDIQANVRFLAIVEKLIAHGLNNREVAGAFGRRYAIKVSVKKGKLSLDEANAKAFSTDVADIERHFEAFLKTTKSHYDFCKQEKDERNPKTPIAKADERAATRRFWAKEQARAESMAKEPPKDPNAFYNEIADAGGWARIESPKPTQKTQPAHVGSGNSMGYMAGAVVFGLLGIIFWPLLILAAICLLLFFFVGVFNFDPVEDGKKVEGFGVLNGLPVGCAIPLLILAIILFAMVMAGKK